jgi:uncharacterized OB-fold protein
MPSDKKGSLCKEFVCKKCGACFASEKAVCVVCKSAEVNEIKEHGTAAKDKDIQIEE